MSGAVGLRYEALAFALEMEQVPRTDWPDVTSGVQTMEQETLRLWREKD